MLIGRLSKFSEPGELAAKILNSREDYTGQIVSKPPFICLLQWSVGEEELVRSDEPERRW